MELIVATALVRTHDHRRSGCIRTAFRVGQPRNLATYVGTIDDASARIAVKHLLELGHRRIAHLAGADVRHHPATPPGVPTELDAKIALIPPWCRV